jgi:OOP family OmpA-OmpF porin
MRPMNAKAFLVILLFLFWSLGSGWYYVSEVKKVYPTSKSLVEVKPAILFGLNDAKPIISEKYIEFKQGLLSRIGDFNKLKITGLYSADEINSTSFENLGIARAIAIQNMLEEVGQERVTIAAEQIDVLSNALTVDGVSFHVFVCNEVYEETEFGAVIYDVDSLDGGLNISLDNYLKFLSKEENNRRIDLTGHTDDIGDEGENYRSALKSANIIREALIAKGVLPENINANSKGQSEPVADNSTEEGRSQNRRIELVID